MSVSASFTQSVTPSLNQVDSGLEDHLENTQYWASLQTPSVGVSPSIAASAFDASRFLTYRERARPQQVPTAPKVQPVRFDELGMSTSVEPALNPRLYPNTAEKTKQLPPAEKPATSTAHAAPQTKPASPQQEEDDAAKWKALLERARTALGMKTSVQVCEESIQSVFERLLTKVEAENVRKNHGVPGVPRGAVLKSVPRCASENAAAGGSQVNAVLQGRYKPAKNVTETPASAEDLTLEETMLKAQLGELSRTQLTGVLLACARLLPQPPSSCAEIPVLLRALVRNSPQVLQLQSLLQAAHEKLGLLYAGVPGAPETRRFAAFCPRLQEEFLFILEKQFAVLENALADYREAQRVRQRAAEAVGVSLSPLIRNEVGTVCLYDSIKLGNLVLEKIQLALQAAAHGASQSNTDLAADELLERAVEAKLFQNPLGDEALGRQVDTLLYARGKDQQKYTESSLKMAAAAAPKLLIRLTEQEAFEAFKAICFVMNHFSTLFATPSVNQMLTKLSELRQYVDTSRALLAAVRKHLGLPPNASANKIIEAIQVISDRALDDADAGHTVGEAARLLRVEPERLLEKIREIAALCERLENEEENEEIDESDNANK